MTKIKILKVILLFICIIIGYSDYYISDYVRIFHSNKMVINKKISNFEKKCNKKTDELICKKKYSIPREIHKKESYLGIGRFASSLKIFCKNSPQASYNIYDITDSKNIFNIINKYIVLNTKILNCDQNIIIEAWSPKSHRRSGYQGGDLVSGSYQAIESIKSLTEFFTKYLYIIIIFLTFPISAYYFYAYNNNIITQKDMFLEASPYFILKLLIASNFVETLVPFNFHFEINNVIVFASSILVHLSPLIFLIFRRNSRLFTFFIFVLLICISLFNDYIIKYSYIIYIPVITTYFLLSLTKKSDTILFYSFFLLLSVMKVYEFNYTPNARIISIYYFLLIFLTIINFLKKYDSYLNILRTLFNSKHPTTNISRAEIENLVHDIRTPLAVISNEAGKFDSESLIPTSIERLDNIVSNFNVKSFKRIDLSHFDGLVNEKKVLFKKDILLSNEAGLTSFNIDINFLRVLSNLLDNAIEASKDSQIELSITTNDSYYSFAISNYTKIPQEILDKLNSGIEFTTKSYGNGIGAKSAKEWVEKNKGTIEYKASGEVIVKLPLA